MNKKKTLFSAGFAIAWVVTRLIVLWQFAVYEQHLDSDVRYYYHQVNDHGFNGLVEYPTPIAVFAVALHRLTGSLHVFAPVFIVITLAVDLLVAIVMAREGKSHAACYWSLFTFIIGPLVWLRLDIFTAASVGLGLLWLSTRPAASGAMLAVGAATKLWPAILAFPAMGADGVARRRTLSFLITGGLLGVGSLIFFGWDRSISPLGWQSDRGLQIESIGASWLMAQNGFGLDPSTHVFFSEWNAFEVTSDNVDFWLTVTDIAMVAAIVIALVLTWLLATSGFGVFTRSARQLHTVDEDSRSYAITLAFIAIISLVIVANKTLSPQYMMWLAGPLAILTTHYRDGNRFTPCLVLLGLGLVIVSLTHLVYPYYYDPLFSPSDQTKLATVILLTRNALMVLFTLVSTALAGREAVRFAHATGQA